ncbi:MAG: lamin tail domain-containing protein [Clostridia bacterium]|nr:lamin tail domain-containing protein [Clostridia bacterium]
MENNENAPVFEAYESEEDVLHGELSFEGEFSRERIGWSRPAVFIVLAVVAAALLGIAAMILLLPKSDGHPIINEVMTSNDSAFLHPDHGSVDWIELYNPTDRDIDLGGYGLTDELKKQYKYTFPTGTVLKSHAYLVLYCTGGTTASDADPYCTGFALSQEGEQLYLIDGSYVELDEVNVPFLETDTAYARTESGAFAVTTVATPGEKNMLSGQ